MHSLPISDVSYSIHLLLYSLIGRQVDSKFVISYQIIRTHLLAYLTGLNYPYFDFRSASIPPFRPLHFSHVFSSWKHRTMTYFHPFGPSNVDVVILLADVKNPSPDHIHFVEDIIHLFGRSIRKIICNTFWTEGLSYYFYFKHFLVLLSLFQDLAQCKSMVDGRFTRLDKEQSVHWQLVIVALTVRS